MKSLYEIETYNSFTSTNRRYIIAESLQEVSNLIEKWEFQEVKSITVIPGDVIITQNTEQLSFRDKQMLSFGYCHGMESGHDQTVESNYDGNGKPQFHIDQGIEFVQNIEKTAENIGEYYEGTGEN